MHNMSFDELKKKATAIRISIIESLAEAGSGHPGGSLGMTDIFTALYFDILRLDPKNPNWEDRDRLILSNGHICPVRYATMAHAGYFPLSELKTLRQLGTKLQGHPERTKLDGLETTSGPLGSGLAQAAGISYGARMDKKDFRVFCICSDGEHQEGNHWEAVAFAAKNKLTNLTLFVDRNNIQISGLTEDIMPLDSLIAKYTAFNWHVLEIDGHNFQEIISSVNEARSTTDKPTVIIARTIPGKGVSFMEGQYEWHGKAPNKEETKEALSYLHAQS